jgi:PPOX class probable FMN-dependent enzyme
MDTSPHDIPHDIPWLSLWRTALARNGRERYVQIATVSPEGLPQVRTVVLRGTGEAGEPYFYTDTRSQKAAAFAKHPHAELHVYWSKTKEQFRLQGDVTVTVTQDNHWQARRRELWHAQRDEARQLLLGAAPGTPVADLEGDLEHHYTSLDSSQKDPPDTFALVVMQPCQVDYLKLASPQVRQQYHLTETGWHGGQVVP